MKPSFAPRKTSGLDLEIRVPDGEVLRARIRGLQAADASGRFGIFSGHENFLTLPAPCVVLLHGEDGLENYAAVDGGFLWVENNVVSLVTREAVLADRLEEVAGAASAMLQARQELEKTARTEFAELQATLFRELRKLEGKR